MKAILYSAIFLLCSAGLAFSQAACTEREIGEATLEDEFGETVQVAGLADGAMVMFWGNEETGTWSITATDGEMICLLASGSDFVLVLDEPNPGETF